MAGYVQVQLVDEPGPDPCGALHVHLWALDVYGQLWAFMCFEGEVLAVIPAEQVGP